MLVSGAICAGILRLEDRPGRRSTLTKYGEICCTLIEDDTVALQRLVLAALAAAAAAVAAARAVEARPPRPLPLRSPPVRPARPLPCCSTLWSLSLKLDMQRGSQLVNEQPHALRRVVAASESSERLAQSAGRGADLRHGGGRLRLSGHH